MRVEAVFTEGPGVLEDKLELGRRVPNWGEILVERRESSEMLKSENFRISGIVPPPVLSSLPLPTNTWIYSSIFHFGSLTSQSV